MNRRCYLGAMGLLVLFLQSIAHGQCSVLVPKKSALSLTEGIRCAEGQACEVSPCEGWLVVEAGPVQVVFRNTANRSDVRELTSGRFNLGTLETGGSLTAAIRNLISTLLGRSDPNLNPLAGRAALGSGVDDALPSGPVAVLPNAGLSFSMPGVAAGTVYAFRPQDNAAAVTRVIAGADGRFHIDAQALSPGTRFVGGLEGGATAPFQVPPVDRLERVALELGSPQDLTPTAAAYRRALIYFDNGFVWNAERELGELVAQGEGTP